MKRFLIIAAPVVVLAGGILIVILLVLAAPKPQKKDEGPRPVSAFVASVEQKSVHLSVTTQGEVRPRTEIDLVSQVSGRIVYVAPEFVEGGIITEGQDLIRIEDKDFELGVVRARARVAEAEQNLQREQAEAELARKDWEELGEGTPSPLTLRQPQLADARAKLAAAKADLEDAQLKLNRTRITASFTGRVRQKQADLGQIITAGVRLGRIFATDLVEIRLPLTDRELGLLNLPVAFAASADGGPEVTLSGVVAGELRQWKGRVVRTESAIDPQTRVLYAIAEVVDPYGKGADEGAPLAVGLFVDAEIKGRELSGALVVPRAALRGVDKVFVVNAKDELEIRAVEVIFSSIEGAVLRSGVRPGERVIISPLREPRNGMKIAILTGEPAEPPTSDTPAPVRGEEGTGGAP